MRGTWVVPVVLFSGVLLLPVAESRSLPLDGIKLVAETRTPGSELAVAGKNGNKSGSGGNQNGKGGGSTTGSAGQAAGGFGGFGTFFVNRGLSAPTDGELVAVDIR